jgi:hypothetical protein
MGVDGRPAQGLGVAGVGALLAMLAGLLVWLWPIGVGGRMPVGGDVTQFSIGLMAVLARAIHAGRLPIWNDLWGYGFPGLAESQMGVYYPPHLLLYGLLPLEAAYTVSLVAHTLWGGLGAFWAARRFGVSATGAALAGFSWAGSGFSLIHLPHQWSYTTGSWMPWAWGLAWVLVRGAGTRRTPLVLALVLTLQVLPGHFQLAFYTQVGVALVGLTALAEPALRREGGKHGAGAVALALIAMIPLGAMQLVPTFRLARLAASQRDYEFLSGFAATPVHLVSYVAPGFFQHSPLWRPVAWDSFRTSPEEQLAYIGLVPLFLAVGVLLRETRREPATRVLGVLALITLILSLGPYVPGFRLLIRLPGFSFFRAPARWGLATELALCLLAGRGFDALRAWPRPGRALARFVFVAALAPCLIIGLIELALLSTERPGWPLVERAFTLATRLFPEPGAPPFREWMNEARRLQSGWRVEFPLARQGVVAIPPAGLRFSQERGSIYVDELGQTAVLLAALLAIAPMAHRRRFLEAALLALSALDLWALAQRRPIDLGPIRSLTGQSPVLARLTGAPRGSRTIDPARNLPMVAGAAPVQAYRTLDLPVLGPLTRLAGAPLGRIESHTMILGALRATGTSFRVLDPSETMAAGRFSWQGLPGWSSRVSVHDPALAGWLYGTDWVAERDRRLATFTLWQPGPSAARAWLVPLTAGRSATILEASTGEPDAVLGVLETAEPLAIRLARPEQLELTLESRGPAVVVLSQLADPQWRGRWLGTSGTRPAAIAQGFARPHELGWQAVTVPGPGRWTLRMEYQARDVQVGLIVSGLSFLIGLGIFLRPGRKPST